MPEYSIPDPVECRLLNLGLNDTYVVIIRGGERYILRVYRHKWRTLSDILFEMDVLDQLHTKGVSVSIPVRRKDGRLLGTVAAPEGERYVVLFTYAPGQAPAYDDDRQAYQYGKAVAAVHVGTEDFRSPHPRFVLDLEYLIHAPMNAIKPHLEHRPLDWSYLQNVAATLTDKLAAIPPQQLQWGYCHGDLHGWNAGFAEDGTVTLYDFDCGGFGWRAYDVAVFRWSPINWEKQARLWPSFLRGYGERHRLPDADMETIPLFIGIRHLWYLGVHASNAQDFGWGWIDDRYYDRELGFLRRWETECLGKEGAG